MNPKKWYWLKLPASDVLVPEAVRGNPNRRSATETPVVARACGFAVIAPVIRLAAALLRPGGAVGIEHDDGHAEAVPALLARDGAFAGIEDHRDLAGRPRFATARRTITRINNGPGHGS